MGSFFSLFYWRFVSWGNFIGIKSYIGDLLCGGCACVRHGCVCVCSVLELIGINKRNGMEGVNCFGIFKVMKRERIQPKDQISRTTRQIMCNLKRRAHYKWHWKSQLTQRYVFKSVFGAAVPSGLLTLKLFAWKLFWLLIGLKVKWNSFSSCTSTNFCFAGFIID